MEVQLTRLFLGALTAFVFSFSAFFGSQAFAANRTQEQAQLEQQFISEFYTQYHWGKCGVNIMGLLDRARANGIDVSRAQIVRIQNAGNSVFGMVNAEYVRQEGRLLPQLDENGFKFAPGETNWYFHVVLELDG